MCGCIGKVRLVKSCKTGQTCFAVLAAGVQDENGIIFDLNMSGEMHMRRRNEVFGCIPHGRGASEKWQKRSDLFCTYCDM